MRDAFFSAVRLAVGDLDFSVAPFYRGSATIPRHQVQFIESDGDVEVSGYYASPVRVHARIGDVLITKPRRRAEPRVTHISAQEFDDTFEIDPFHQNQYRSTLVARAFFVTAPFCVNFSSARHRVCTAGIVQNNKYLVCYESGVTYENDTIGQRRKFDKSNAVYQHGVPFFQREFARTDARGKTQISMEIPLAKQLELVARRSGWEVHKRAIEGEMAYHGAKDAQSSASSAPGSYYASSFQEALIL